MTVDDSLIRRAIQANVGAFVDMVMSLDDPAIVIGPRYLNKSSQSHPAPLTQYDFMAGFRSPFGHLGYRHASVAEADGEVAGFMICVPFDLLKDEINGAILPERTIHDRYGKNTSSVLNLSFLCVKKMHRKQRISLKLVSQCRTNAFEDGYRNIMTQMWKQNEPMCRCAARCGFEPLHETACQYSARRFDSFVFVDQAIGAERGAS
jgi:hypothetical protein